MTLKIIVVFICSVLLLAAMAAAEITLITFLRDGPGYLIFISIIGCIIVFGSIIIAIIRSFGYKIERWVLK